MSDKIDKLTPEQEAEIPKYVEKWIKIGTNTDRLDYDKTLRIVNGFRKIIEMEEAPLVICENPIEAWVLCCLHEHGVPQDELQAEMELVFNGNPKKWEIPAAQIPYQDGSFFAPSFSFYDYMLECLGVEIESDLWAKYKTWEATAEIGMIYPLDKITFVCQKPTEIHLNENNVLHKDGGPALAYSGLGDFKIYSLNGVTVPEYLAVTPAHELKIEDYHKESNADVKAEFVRKVGIEAFKAYGKKLDSYENYSEEEQPFYHTSQYELWDMEAIFDGLTKAPYISMVNPTTKIYHFEGVSPACNTIEDALRERFGGRADFIIKNMA